MGKSYIIMCKHIKGVLWEIHFGGFGPIMDAFLGSASLNNFLMEFPQFVVNPSTGAMKWTYTEKDTTTPPLSAVQKIINSLLDGKNGQITHSSALSTQSPFATYTWTINV